VEERNDNNVAAKLHRLAKQEEKEELDRLGPGLSSSGKRLSERGRSSWE